MVDARVSGARAERRAGSSPVLGTDTESRAIYSLFCFLPSPQLIGLLIDKKVVIL